MYASKTPHDLNHDPLPYVWNGHHPTARKRDDCRTTFRVSPDYERDPRPEFDHVQHNEPNPALIELRANLTKGGAANARAIIRIRLKSLEWAMAEHENGWQRFTPETVAHIDHARRVLMRLANLAVQS